MEYHYDDMENLFMGHIKKRIIVFVSEEYLSFGDVIDKQCGIHQLIMT